MSGRSSPRTIEGAMGLYVFLFVALVAAMIVGGATGTNRTELRKIVGAPLGTTHATNVRRGAVRLTVRQYQLAGWQPTHQERLRTPGNRHLVAMTFRKV